MLPQGLDSPVTDHTESKRRILLIEDNEADATLTRLVHDEVNHCSWLEVVRSGSEAIAYLQNPANIRPDVILMDVLLPMKSGIELIPEIRAVQGCELMPIVLISGTSNPVTLREAYQLGANCVIRKASTWEEYFRKLECCFEFWCGVAELPHPPAAATAP